MRVWADNEHVVAQLLRAAPEAEFLCLDEGHIHDHTTQIDVLTGVIIFFQVCGTCNIRWVIHQEEYVPCFNRHGNTPHLDLDALACTQIADARRHYQVVREAA